LCKSYELGSVAWSVRFKVMFMCVGIPILVRNCYRPIEDEPKSSR
jgi:hypothetical protein